MCGSQPYDTIERGIYIATFLLSERTFSYHAAHWHRGLGQPSAGLSNYLTFVLDAWALAAGDRHCSALLLTHNLLNFEKRIRPYRPTLGLMAVAYKDSDIPGLAVQLLRERLADRYADSFALESLFGLIGAIIQTSTPNASPLPTTFLNSDLIYCVMVHLTRLTSIHPVLHSPSLFHILALWSGYKLLLDAMTLQSALYRDSLSVEDGLIITIFHAQGHLAKYVPSSFSSSTEAQVGFSAIQDLQKTFRLTFDLLSTHLMYRFIRHRVLTAVRRVEAKELEAVLPQRSPLRQSWFSLKTNARRYKDIISSKEYQDQLAVCFPCRRLDFTVSVYLLSSVQCFYRKR